MDTCGWVPLATPALVLIVCRQGPLRGVVLGVARHRADPAPRGGVHRAPRRSPGGLEQRVPVGRRLRLHQELPADVHQPRGREALR